MPDSADLPTTRIPAVEPATQPIPHQPPEWLPGHWQPTPSSRRVPDGLALRAVVAATSLAVLVATGGLWSGGSLLWLLAIMPGAPVAAAAVVGVAALARSPR